jgi:phosphoglycerate dehydrogenase-like enzyme
MRVAADPSPRAATTTVVIASPLELGLVERIRAVDRQRLRVIHEPGLIPRAQHAADHDGIPPDLDPPSLARWRAILASADVLLDVDWQAPADTPTNAPRARWIQLTRSGVGETLRELGLDRSGIVFTNAAGVHAVPLAEFVVLGLMYLFKDVHGLREEQAQRTWAPPGLVFRVLAGSRVLLIGLGGLGRQVAVTLAGLGVEVWGHRRGEGAAPPGVARVVGGPELHDALGRVDALVVACPYTAETHHMIGAAELAALPAGAFVVNIARGAIIDEAALVDALASGHLGGAALDVFEMEPLPATSPLWAMRNVLISPHRASVVEAENGLIVDIFVDNLRRYLDGRPLRNVFDPARGY